MKKFIQSRNLRYGGLSVLIAIIFVLMIVVVNLLAGALGQKYLGFTVDLTREKLFELSQESVEYIEKLDKPVEITVLMDEKQLKNSSVYYSQIKNTIDEYKKCSSQIQVHYLDPVINPGILATYGDADLEYYDVVVQCGEKFKVVSLLEMFPVSMNPYTGEEKIVASVAEQELTSAIVQVVSEKATTVNLVLGHDEEYADELMVLLEKNGYLVQEVNLSTEELNTDAAMIFLLSPKRDLELEQIEKIQDFLVNNGDFGKTMLYAPSSKQYETPNLDAFLLQWGVAVGQGVVVETDSRKFMNNMPYFCLLEYTDTAYTEGLNSEVQAIAPVGRELTAVFEDRSGYTTLTILSFSGTSAVMPPDADSGWMPKKDELGTRPALLCSTLTKIEGTNVKESKLFTAATSAMLETSALSSPSVSNAEYFASLFNTASDKDHGVMIAPKQLEARELGINQFWLLILGMLFVIIVPLAVLGMGVGIWLRRKNR